MMMMMMMMMLLMIQYTNCDVKDQLKV